MSKFGRVATQDVTTSNIQRVQQYSPVKDLNPTLFQQKSSLGFLDSDFGHSGPGTKLPDKIAPKYKGYNRSGQLLFNNMAQKDIEPFKSPRSQVTSPVESRFSKSLNQTLKVPSRGANRSSSHSNYQAWQSNNILNNQKQLRSDFVKQPLKQSKELDKTMDLVHLYSPDYNLKKINNYDNTIKNATREVFKNFDMKPNYNKVDKTLSNFKPGQSQDFQVPKDENANLGSSVGNSNRAFLYASYRKNSRNGSDNNSIDPAKVTKVDFKKSQADYINNWNHFDSNINNTIVEQRKIIQSKNYELDSRAWGLKDYGFQPKLANSLKQKREIDTILCSQTIGKDPQERLPAFRKKFTPITTYCKSLHDSKVTSEYGPSFSAYRANLNFS